MSRISRRRIPLNDDLEPLSEQKRKMLHDASLDTLKKLYEKCYEEKIPFCPLIDAIEKEIYIKIIDESGLKADRIYFLEKFVPKKKKALK
jgi:hypothetical protein